MQKINNFLQPIKFLVLPILLSIYPVLFHYANNFGVASISTAVRLALWITLLTTLIYLTIVFLGGFQYLRAANAGSTFLLFFLFYGLIYDYLRELDVFHLEHFSFLPFFVSIAIYLSLIVFHTNIKASYHIWKGGLLITSGLLLFNALTLMPFITRSLNPELRASYASNADQFNPTTTQRPNTSDANTALSQPTKNLSNFPDIYYIIFDEMASFEAIRKYWNYSKVDEFVDYLKDNGFYVAENSYASAPATLNQLATRLNYEVFPFSVDPDLLKQNRIREHDSIRNNKSMNFLKGIGYTTVVFTEMNPLVFTGMPSMPSDFLYEKPDIPVSSFIIDDFTVLILKQTLFYAFLSEDLLLTNKFTEHQEMIFFTIKKTHSLKVPSPKFVYIHLIFPHIPFLFDQHGQALEPKNYYNWNMYLGQYIYALHLAETLLDGILQSADPANPPVIIFQSDHGARNSFGANLLTNYPEEYKTWIVNAMHLPDCEDAPLTQDIDPINTFPIVFNCYFDANIPLK